MASGRAGYKVTKLQRENTTLEKKINKWDFSQGSSFPIQERLKRVKIYVTVVTL